MEGKAMERKIYALMLLIMAWANKYIKSKIGEISGVIRNFMEEAGVILSMSFRLLVVVSCLFFSVAEVEAQLCSGGVRFEKPGCLENPVVDKGIFQIYPGRPDQTQPGCNSNLGELSGHQYYVSDGIYSQFGDVENAKLPSDDDSKSYLLYKPSNTNSILTVRVHKLPGNPTNQVFVSFRFFYGNVKGDPASPVTGTYIKTNSSNGNYDFYITKDDCPEQVHQVSSGSSGGLDLGTSFCGDKYGWYTMRALITLPEYLDNNFLDIWLEMNFYNQPAGDVIFLDNVLVSYNGTICVEKSMACPGDVLSLTDEVYPYGTAISWQYRYPDNSDQWFDVADPSAGFTFNPDGDFDKQNLQFRAEVTLLDGSKSMTDILEVTMDPKCKPQVSVSPSVACAGDDVNLKTKYYPANSEITWEYRYPGSSDWATIPSGSFISSSGGETSTPFTYNPPQGVSSAEFRAKAKLQDGTEIPVSNVVVVKTTTSCPIYVCEIEEIVLGRNDLSNDGYQYLDLNGSQLFNTNQGLNSTFWDGSKHAVVKESVFEAIENKGGVTIKAKVQNTNEQLEFNFFKKDKCEKLEVTPELLCSGDAITLMAENYPIGSTVTWQYSYEGSSWETVPNGSFTMNSDKVTIPFTYQPPQGAKKVQFQATVKRPDGTEKTKSFEVATDPDCPIYVCEIEEIVIEGNHNGYEYYDLNNNRLFNYHQGDLNSSYWLNGKEFKIKEDVFEQIMNNGGVVIKANVWGNPKYTFTFKKGKNCESLEILGDEPITICEGETPTVTYQLKGAAGTYNYVAKLYDKNNVEVNAISGSWTTTADPADVSLILPGNISFGEYSLKLSVNDQEFDAVTRTVTVKELPKVVVSSDPICAGTSDAPIATMTPSDGMTFEWVNTPTWSSLSAGTHTVSYKVTSDNGCFVEGTTDVTVEAPIVFELAKAGPICKGESVDLKVDGNVSGVVANTDAYQWYEGGVAISGATSATYTVSPESTTEYSLTIKGNKCEATTRSVEVEVEEPIVFELAKSGPICKGESVDLKVEGNVRGFVANTDAYQWYEGGVAIPGATGVTYTASPESTTEYSLTIKGNKCEATTKSVKVEVEEPIDFTLAEVDAICEGESVELKVDGAVTGTLAENNAYQWYKGSEKIEGATSPSYELQNATVTASADYTLTVSGKKCKSVSKTVSVVVKELPDADLTAEPICQGLTVAPKVPGNWISGWNYGWINEPAWETLSVGVHKQKYVVTAPNGCSAEGEMDVTVEEPIQITMPKVETLCVGAFVELTPTSVTGTLANNPYSWKGGGQTSVEKTFRVEKLCETITCILTVKGNACPEKSEKVQVPVVRPELKEPWPANKEGQEVCFSDGDFSPIKSEVEIAALYNCTNVTVTFTEDKKESDCEWYVKRVYTIQDACQHDVSPANREIKVSGKDATKPVITTTAENNKDFGCNPTIEAPEFSVTDNCDADITSKLQVTAGTILENGCSRSQTWTATATDACNNVAEAVSITYTWTEDNVNPVITTTAVSGDLGCNPTIEAPEFSVTDNCDADITSKLQVTAGTILENGCSRSQTWTATATDACNNVAEAVSITYTWTEDNVNPVITTTAVSGDLGCNPTIEAPEFSVTDNCDKSVTVEVKTTGVEGTGCEKRQTWTATASDACQNAADALSITYIWIEDEEKPVIATTAKSEDKGCNPTIVAPEFTVTDNCDKSVTVEVKTTGVEGTGCEKRQTWTATATDACQNAADALSITYTWIEDEEPPVIATTAKSGDKGCNPTIVAPEFTVTDNCDNNVQVQVTTTGVQGAGYKKTQTWTATAKDVCGNSAEPVVIVYTWIEDSSTPFAVQMPADMVICQGSSVKLIPTIQGDPTSFSWKQGGTEVSTDETYTATPNETTTYHFTAVANECISSSGIVTITVENPISFDLNEKDLVICEGTSVSLEPINIQGDLAQTPYSWTKNGVVVSSAAKLTDTPSANAIYELTISGNKCAKARKSVSVTVEKQPSVHLRLSDNEVCEDENVTLQVTYSNVLGLEWLSKGDSDSEFTVFANNLSATNEVVATNDIMYQVRSTGNQACPVVVSDAVALTVEPKMEISLPSEIAICSKDEKTIEAAFSRTPTSIVWMVKNANAANYHQTKFTEAKIVVNPNVSSYYKVIASSKNCPTAEAEVLLKVEDIPNWKIISQTNNVCEGDEVELSTDLPSDYNFVWEAKTHGSANYERLPESTSKLYDSPMESTTYRLSVQTSAGCSAGSKLYDVKVDKPVYGSIADIAICDGDSGRLSVFVDDKSSYSYYWSDMPDYSNVLSRQTSVRVAPKTTTSYYLKIVNGVCTTEYEAEVEVRTLPEIVGIEDMGNRMYRIQVEGGSVPYSYTWGKNSMPTSSDIMERPTYGMTYNVTVTDAIGCKVSDVVEVPTYELEIPEYFFPEIEKWKVKNLDRFYGSKVTIYDRFGKMLKEYDVDQFKGWDGTYLGSPMPSTDYWYVISIQELDKELVGHFTLRRRNK